jgi:hypothetical protein
MTLDWIPGPSYTSLTGKLTMSGTPILTLGTTKIPVQLQPEEEGTLSELVLPPEFGLRAAVTTPEMDTEHTIILRPGAFDASAVCGHVEQYGTEALSAAGLLDAFLSLPRKEDKLATAWLAIAKLEEGL